MISSVADSVHELHSLVRDFPAELRKVSDADASMRRSDGGWSRKELLGHLIDSATVNHQRFVRAQMESGFSFLYAQNEWVRLHRYQDRPWTELIDLWTALNRHLLYVIERIPEDKLENVCGEGEGDEPWTLSYRIPDYLGHMRHHIEQMRRLA